MCVIENQLVQHWN